MYNYLVESKVLRYFVNMKHYWAAPDSFDEMNSWERRITLKCEIPDTLLTLLTRVTAMTSSTASESSSLWGLPGWSRFLQPERNFFKHLVTELWSTAPSSLAQQMFFFCLLWRYYGPVRTRKAQVLELDYIERSFVQLLNHIRNEAMHNMSAYQVPQYYQPKQILFTAWTASVMWYTCCRLARIQIL